MLVTLWRLDHPTARLCSELVELRNPDGRVLGDLRTDPFVVGGQTPFHFNYTRFNEVIFTAAGTYEVRILLMGEEDGTRIRSFSCPLLIT